MGDIANRQQSTEEEIRAAKMAGTFCQFGRIVTEAGHYSVIRRAIDDLVYREELYAFHKNYIPAGLNYVALLKWFKESHLEKHLIGGSLEKQVKDWEIFYQKFYGEDFRLNRKKIFIEARRLPAIKVGLEIGAVNSVQIETTLKVLIGEELGMTEAEFFFHRILEPTGIDIWAKTGRGRWTGKTLDEVLTGYIPVVLEDFNLVALKKDWARECWRVVERKEPTPTVVPGIVRLNFVNGRRDIPSSRKYISQTGEVVKVRDCSFIEAVEKNIRLVTPVQEILLAAKMFSDSGEYLARDTCEFNLALLRHKEKTLNVSVADAASRGGGFSLDSDRAAHYYGGRRFRISL